MHQPDDATLHDQFLAILPRIELHAKVYFRHLRCPHRKADAIAETVALAFLWFIRLAARGKDASQFVTTLATFAACHAGCGRRLTGQEKAKDVMSPRAQKHHGFQVEPLPSSTCTSHERLYSLPRGQDLLDAFEERLRDNTLTPVDEQVAFRLDFPAWLITRTERDRRIIDSMSAGERTLDLANAFGISPARVSQLRRDYQQDWARFCGEAIA